MENALIQFMLINLKQRLKKRGKNRGESGTAARIHKCSLQYATGHVSEKSTMSFGHPVCDGHVYVTVVSERD